MSPEEIAAKEAATAAAAAAEAAKKAAEDAAHSTPDPLEEERKRIEGGKGKKTELEKALFTQKQISERIKILKGESGDDSGLEDEILDDEEDDKPVTVGMLKKLEQSRSATTALSMADNEIEDENELIIVKHHLENSIKPSGNAKEDLRKARAITNELKTKQLFEESNRRGEIRRSGKGNGAPGRNEELFEPTAEEMKFMKAPFNLTKEKILAARKAGEPRE